MSDRFLPAAARRGWRHPVSRVPGANLSRLAIERRVVSNVGSRGD